MNPRDNVLFHKSIILSQYDGIQNDEGLQSGQMRYNRIKKRFEGYHDEEGADADGNRWRAFQLDIATMDRLGGVKIGRAHV